MPKYRQIRDTKDQYINKDRQRHATKSSQTHPNDFDDDQVYDGQVYDDQVWETPESTQAYHPSASSP